MDAELIFLPGLVKMVLFFAGLAVLLGLLERLDKWLTSRRRRHRDQAANHDLEAKRQNAFDRDYLSRVEADMRANGIPVDSGFLASLSGEKYVS